MQRIQIEVTQAALKKMVKAGIRYKVINEDINIEDFLMRSDNVDELDDHEVYQIVEVAKQAISQGAAFGIMIETRSGRDMNDERCYTLMDVCVVAADHHDCSHTVAALIKGSK